MPGPLHRHLKANPSTRRTHDRRRATRIIRRGTAGLAITVLAMRRGGEHGSNEKRERDDASAGGFHGWRFGWVYGLLGRKTDGRGKEPHGNAAAGVLECGGRAGPRAATPILEYPRAGWSAPAPACAPQSEGGVAATALHVARADACSIPRATSAVEFVEDLCRQNRMRRCDDATMRREADAAGGVGPAGNSGFGENMGCDRRTDARANAKAPLHKATYFSKSFPEKERGPAGMALSEGRFSLVPALRTEEAAYGTSGGRCSGRGSALSARETSLRGRVGRAAHWIPIPVLLPLATKHSFPGHDPFRSPQLRNEDQTIRVRIAAT